MDGRAIGPLQPNQRALCLCDTLSHRHFRDRCTPRAGSAGGCHSHGPACRASRHLHRRRRSVSEACTLICKKCCCHLDFTRLLRPEIKSGQRKMGKPGCVAFPPTRIAFAQRVRDAGAQPAAHGGYRGRRRVDMGHGGGRWFWVGGVRPFRRPGRPLPVRLRTSRFDGRALECCTTELRGSMLRLWTVCNVSDGSDGVSIHSVATGPSLGIM
jgi:hypothetical protein